MKISISFSIVILAIAGLAHSAPPPPQEKPSTSVSSAFGENDLKEIAEIFQSFDKKTKTPNKDVVPKLLKDLSGECKTALLSIVAEPEFSKCVPLSALEPLVPILTPDLIKGLASNTTATLKKIQSNLVEFSTDVCKAPKCSDKGLESALKSVQDGCKADLDNKLIKLVIAGVSLYSPARDAVCTKDDKGKFCLSGDDIDGLKASLIVMVGGILDDIAASDTKDVCAECNGKIVNTFFSYIESESPLAKAAKEVFGKQGDKKLGAAKLGVALKCGVESLVLPKSPKHSQPTNTTSTTSSTSPTSRPTRPPKHSSSPTSVSLSPTFPTEPPKHSSKKTNPTPDSTDLPKQTSTSY